MVVATVIMSRSVESVSENALRMNVYGNFWGMSKC